MKVVILAGGFGTRLGSITETLPKPMVCIGDKPVLWHIMKTYDHYGFNDFVLSLGYKAEKIKEYFANYHVAENDCFVDLAQKSVKVLPSTQQLGWKITMVNTGLNTLKGARVKRLEKYLDDVNLMTYGDGVADLNIKDLVKFHQKHKKMITITGVRPPSRFGELNVVDGKIISFEEKPQTKTGLINGGFMVFNKELLNYLSTDETCDLEYGPFNELAAKGEMMVYQSSGQWECVDTERDLKHLNHLWETGQAFWKVWK